MSQLVPFQRESRKMGSSSLRNAFIPALVTRHSNLLIIHMKKRLTTAGKSKITIVAAAMIKRMLIIEAY